MCGEMEATAVNTVKCGVLGRVLLRKIGIALSNATLSNATRKGRKGPLTRIRLDAARLLRVPVQAITKFHAFCGLHETGITSEPRLVSRPDVCFQVTWRVEPRNACSASPISRIPVIGKLGVCCTAR